MMLSNTTQKLLDKFIEKKDPFAEMKTKILTYGRYYQIENCKAIQASEMFEIVNKYSLEEIDKKLIESIQKYPDSFEDRFKLSHAPIDTIN
jgi:hypothetical protein